MERKHLNVRTWQYNSTMQFPENNFLSTQKQNIGLAFSGGGNRSASLTIGYLRALKHLGVLEKVKYISSVSGGGWAAIPFTFLDKSIEDDLFLGSYINPENLRMNDLKLEDDRSFTTTISRTVLVDNLIGNIFSGDKLFAAIMSEIYLKPYLINDRAKFFSWNKETVNEIISRNDSLRISDFLTAKDDRPYLISGGVLTRSFLSSIERYPFEMTPLYTGIPTYFPNAGSMGNFDLGGGYVEPCGFDSDSPSQINTNGIANVRIKKGNRVFSLSDVMATTGAALAEHLDRFLVDVGFPEFDYWSPRNPEKSKEYDFADGGLMDNSGIMPLLRRKVKKIIVFVNGTSDLFSNDTNTNEKVSTMVKALFVPIDKHFGKKDYSWNIVLKEPELTPKESYESLRDEFLSLNKQGKPAIVQRKYVTISNTRFGIEEGQEAEIIWVHNAFVDDWFDKLKDPDLKNYVLSQREKKFNFPNYPTFLINGARIIDYDIEQANLMSHFASQILVSQQQQMMEFFT